MRRNLFFKEHSQSTTSNWGVRAVVQSVLIGKIRISILYALKRQEIAFGHRGSLVHHAGAVSEIARKLLTCAVLKRRVYGLSFGPIDSRAVRELILELFCLSVQSSGSDIRNVNLKRFLLLFDVDIHRSGVHQNIVSASDLDATC